MWNDVKKWVMSVFGTSKSGRLNGARQSTASSNAPLRVSANHVVHPLMLPSGAWKVHGPRLLVITGSGLSVASGLSTFRRQDGLWNGRDVNKVCNGHTWKDHHPDVMAFYSDLKQKASDASANDGHRALARLSGHVVVATQNVDGLLERCNVPSILLHGQLNRYYCGQCKKTWEIEWLAPYPSKCHVCSNTWIKPGVVFFHEPVPLYQKLELALSQLRSEDVVAVVGTSGEVLPIGRWLRNLECQKWLFNLTPEFKLPNHIFHECVFGDFEQTHAQLTEMWNAHKESVFRDL